MRISSLLITLAVVTGSAHADAVFIMDSRDAGEAVSKTMQISVSGKDLRMDSGPDGSMVFRGGSGTLVSLDHQRREYFVIDEATLSSMADQIAPAMEQLREQLASLPPEQAKMMEEMMKQRMGDAMPAMEQVEIRVAKNGETGSVGGYSCEWWDIRENGNRTGTLCMSDVDDVEGGREFGAAMREMAAFYSRMMDKFRGAGVPVPGNPFAQMDQMQGVPVASKQYSGTQVTGESKLLSAKEEDVDSGIFEPPADYKRQSLQR